MTLLSSGQTVRFWVCGGRGSNPDIIGGEGDVWDYLPDDRVTVMRGLVDRLSNSKPGLREIESRYHRQKIYYEKYLQNTAKYSIKYITHSKGNGEKR